MRAQQVEQAGSREHRRFHGLVANFYSLKTKTVPTGRLVLGDWSATGCLLEWASLPNWESGSLLVMNKGTFGKVTKGPGWLW